MYFFFIISKQYTVLQFKVNICMQNILEMHRQNILIQILHILQNIYKNKNHISRIQRYYIIFQSNYNKCHV